MKNLLYKTCYVRLFDCERPSTVSSTLAGTDFHFASRWDRGRWRKERENFDTKTLL